MPGRKVRKPAAAKEDGLFPEVLDLLDSGLLLVDLSQETPTIRRVNRQLSVVLEQEMDDLVGRPESEFWNRIVPRTENPQALRQDWNRIGEDPARSRSDYLYLLRPAPRHVERTLRPIRSPGFHGRLWLFRDASREFDLREEYQLGKYRLSSLRRLSAFLRDAPLSKDSFREICRLTSQGLDVPLVLFVTLGPDGIHEMEQSHPPRVPDVVLDEKALFDWLTRSVVTAEDSTGVSLDFDRPEDASRPGLRDTGYEQWLAMSIHCSLGNQGAILAARSDHSPEWNREERRYLRVLGDLVSCWWARELFRVRLMEERVRTEQASRARSEFIALISHELRTPLNPLVGFTQLLQDLSTELPEETRDMVHRIAQGATRLQSLVEDLLTLTRLDARLDGWQRYHCDVSGILADAVSYGRKEGGGGRVTVEVERDDELGVIEADGAAVRRAVRALLSNAVRYTPEGGVVRLSARIFGGMLTIRVTDQGPGVPDAQKARIFEPFVQGEPVLTRRHGGAGIGLTLVKRVADSHRGRVWLEDGPSGGSSFVLALPVHPGA